MSWKPTPRQTFRCKARPSKSGGGSPEVARFLHTSMPGQSRSLSQHKLPGARALRVRRWRQRAWPGGNARHFEAQAAAMLLFWKMKNIVDAWARNPEVRNESKPHNRHPSLQPHIFRSESHRPSQRREPEGRRRPPCTLGWPQTSETWQLPGRD